MESLQILNIMSFFYTSSLNKVVIFIFDHSQISFPNQLQHVACIQEEKKLARSLLDLENK